jgi:hypothetical protein
MPFQFPPEPIFLQDNWSAEPAKQTFGAGVPMWAKLTGLVDPDVVYLQGAATQTSVTPVAGSDPNLLGTLPPAASPDRVVYAIVHTFNGTYADISISPNGAIELIGPRPPAVKDYSFVSLEGITYDQCRIVPPTGGEGAGGPIPVNGPSWSDTADSTGFPFGASAPAWYRDGGFVVHLQGAAKQVSASGPNPHLLGNLPGPFWPAHVVYTIAHTFNGTYADLSIGTDGAISVIDPRSPAIQDYSFVSLEGITCTLLEEVSNTVIPVNAPNWSDTPDSTAFPFGAGPPTWTSDETAQGVVRLQGAAKRVSASGPNPNLLGTLPPAARPTRVVYTIAHTFNGTYADLSIGTDGAINVIDPRSPAIQDYSFVSLEGISYQQ